MTPKERAAMQQALEALEEIHVGNMTPMAEENWNKAITALREALAEQPDTPNVDCACGDLYPADSFGAGFIAATGHCQNCDVAEQAEREPVAWTYTRKGIYDKLTELGASIVQSCCNVPDKRCGADEWILQTVQIELLLDALAAPVRTKDLTDDELREVLDKHCGDGLMPLSRAVIAADRENNRG